MLTKYEFDLLHQYLSLFIFTIYFTILFSFFTKFHCDLEGFSQTISIFGVNVIAITILKFYNFVYITIINIIIQNFKIQVTFLV